MSCIDLMQSASTAPRNSGKHFFDSKLKMLWISRLSCFSFAAWTLQKIEEFIFEDCRFESRVRSSKFVTWHLYKWSTQQTIQIIFFGVITRSNKLFLVLDFYRVWIEYVAPVSSTWISINYVVEKLRIVLITQSEQHSCTIPEERTWKIKKNYHRIVFICILFV